MNLLPATTITAAVAATVTPWVPLNGTPRNLTAQANFVGGTGGTHVDVYLQTSLDGKLTATDIAHFEFSNTALRAGVNISTTTPAGTPAGATGETTPIALTDGAMDANLAQDGILGPWLRVKYSSTGTYSGGTTIRVDVQSADIPSFP